MFTVESVAPALARCPGTGTASASVVSLAPPVHWSGRHGQPAKRQCPVLPVKSLNCLKGGLLLSAQSLVAIIAAACLLAATWLFVGTWWVVTLSWLAH
jgi:hypothetical protein